MTTIIVVSYENKLIPSPCPSKHQQYWSQEQNQILNLSQIYELDFPINCSFLQNLPLQTISSWNKIIQGYYTHEFMNLIRSQWKCNCNRCDCFLQVSVTPIWWIVSSSRFLIVIPNAQTGIFFRFSRNFIMFNAK